jgi:hypothetical protein
MKPVMRQAADDGEVLGGHELGDPTADHSGVLSPPASHRFPFGCTGVAEAPRSEM